MPLPRTTSTNSYQHILLTFSLLTLFLGVNGQDNSPYSRYGIGDLVPQTNIFTRGMGGLSAAYIDNFSAINTKFCNAGCLIEVNIANIRVAAQRNAGCACVAYFN